MQKFAWYSLIIVAQLGLLLLLAVLASACGGGDPEEVPDQPTPGIDCAAKPEACK